MLPLCTPRLWKVDVSSYRPIEQKPTVFGINRIVSNNGRTWSVSNEAEVMRTIDRPNDKPALLHLDVNPGEHGIDTNAELIRNASYAKVKNLREARDEKPRFSVPKSRREGAKLGWVPTAASRCRANFRGRVKSRFSWKRHQKAIKFALHGCRLLFLRVLTAGSRDSGHH